VGSVSQAIVVGFYFIPHLALFEGVKPPEDAFIIGSHFVFHYKHKSDGNIASWKARLICKDLCKKKV